MIGIEGRSSSAPSRLMTHQALSRLIKVEHDLSEMENLPLGAPRAIREYALVDVTITFDFDCKLNGLT